MPSTSSSYSKISMSCLLDPHGSYANAQLKVRSQSEICVGYSHWMLLGPSSAVVCFRHFAKRCDADRLTFLVDTLPKNTRGHLSAPWRETDRWCEQMHLNTELVCECTVTWLWAYCDLTVSLLWPDWFHCDLTVSMPCPDCELALTWLRLLWPDCEHAVSWLWACSDLTEVTVTWLWACRVLTVSLLWPDWGYCDLTVSMPCPDSELTLTWVYCDRTVSIPCTEYTEYFCVPYGSHNTQRSFPYTELIDRFLGAFVKIEKIDC
jgi:hypothetical protein